MLSKTEKLVNEEIKWREVGKDIFVAHFSSRSNSQQIYIKKIQAKKIVTNAVTLFLFHDLSSHHGRFSNLIEWFQVRHPHINFVLMDSIGHGLSAGTRGNIENFHDLAFDIKTIFESLEKKPDEKWIALGHGMGALGLLDLTNRFDEVAKAKIDKLIISNFILQFSSINLSIQNKLSARGALFNDLMKVMRPLEIYLPNQVLTHSREQMIYMEDPLVMRKPTFQTFQTIEQKVRGIFQDAYFLELPTLALLSKSPYVNVRGVDSFYKGFKKGLLIEKKYLNLKHDLYNERDSFNVFNDIADWIQK